MIIRMAIKETIKAYLILLIAPFLLLAPILLSGQALFWGTPSLQFVPWWWQTWLSLRQGELPLWNPYNGLGAPLLANYQLAFFYPPNWLLLGMAALGGPPAIAFGYSLLAVFHLALAGVGMALLLRQLSFSWFGQVLGGLAFGLSGYLVGRLGFFSMVWVAAWIPWVIYFADGIASPFSQLVVKQSNRITLSIGLTVCLSLQLLAGHAQLTWYSFLLAGLWVTAGGLRQGGLRGIFRAWSVLALSAVVAAGIAAVQLYPTFEYLQVSQRADSFAYEEAMTYSFWPWRFLTLISPDFFGNPALGDYWGYASYWEDHLYAGVLPLLLALATLVLLARGLRKPRRDLRWSLVAFAWAILLIAFLLALGKYTPVFPFLYRLAPTFDMFQAPARFLIWVVFFLPLLAAVGVEHWRFPTGRGLYWFRLATAGAFAIALGAGLAWLFLSDVQPTFIRATALTGMWALGFGLLTLAIPLAQKQKRMYLWQCCVFVWVLADLLVTGWSLNPGVRLEFYASQTQISQKLPIVAGGQRVYLSRQEAYDLKFRRFHRFKDFRPLEDWIAMRETLIPNLNLLDGISLVSNFDPLVTERYSRWMEEIEILPPVIRYAWLSMMNVGVVEKIDGRAANGVRYDLLPDAQRLHWYNCARSVDGLEEAWTFLRMDFNSSPQPDRAVIIETAGQPLQGCLPKSQATVRLEEDLPGRVAISVVAEGAGWLVLADSWYPGWVAFIDGRPSIIYPADALFRAVRLEPGTRKIVFLYRPVGFYFAALFSILVLLLFLIYVRMRRHGENIPMS